MGPCTYATQGRLNGIFRPTSSDFDEPQIYPASNNSVWNLRHSIHGRVGRLSIQSLEKLLVVNA